MLFQVTGLLALALGVCHPALEVQKLTGASDLGKVTDCPCCDFLLEEDIVIDHHVPISDFTGTFNGNGKRLTINSFITSENTSRVGFFAVLRGGHVFNLTVIGPSSLSLGGGITHFGLLAGEAIDPFFYHIQLLTETTITATNAQTSSKSWKYYGGLAGNLLLEGHPMANVLSSSTLNFDFPDYNSYIAVGSLFGAVSGSQRISSVRTSDISVLQVSAPAARRIICGGLVGSVKASRIFSTAVSEGSTLSVTHGASNAEVYLGGLAGEGSQFDYVDSAWVEVECKGNNSTTLQGTCYIGGFVGQLVSTYLDTRLTKGARTRSLGYLRCGDTRTCYVGGLAAYMLHSDISQCESSINIEVDNVVNATVGGLIGLNTGGRIHNSYTVAETLSVMSKPEHDVENATVRAGGLAGEVKRSSSGGFTEVLGCSARIDNFAVTTSDSVSVAGLVGYFNTADVGVLEALQSNDDGGEIRNSGCSVNMFTVTNSTAQSSSTGTITAYIGGLVGYSRLVRITSSYAVVEDMALDLDQKYVYVGGVASVLNTSWVDASFSKLPLVAAVHRANTFYFGGMIGRMVEGSVIVDSYAVVDNVTGNGQAKNLYYGGAIGFIEGLSSVTGSFAMTKYAMLQIGRDNTYFGAFLGDLRINSSVYMSWANGNFTLSGPTSSSSSTSIRLGGFAGRVTNSQVNLSYVHGNFTLTGFKTGLKTRVGAFIGLFSEGGNISYCYAMSSFPNYTFNGNNGTALVNFTSSLEDKYNTSFFRNILCTDCGQKIINGKGNSGKCIYYQTYSGLANYTAYDKGSIPWKSVVAMTDDHSRLPFYIVNESVPRLAQLPNPTTPSALSTPGEVPLNYTLTVENGPPICEIFAFCWVVGELGKWLPPDPAFDNLPLINKGLTNECRGMCRYNDSIKPLPGRVECSSDRSQSFTCQKCVSDNSCNGGTCRRDGICVDCPLGYVGQDCRTAVCMSPSKTPCGGSDTNDPAGQCTLWNGMPVCECNSTFYTYENVCVMRHANWEVTKEEKPPVEEVINDAGISTRDAIIVSVVSAVCCIIAIISGLVFFGIITCSCLSGTKTPRKLLSKRSSSHTTMISADSTELIGSQNMSFI
ncbi:hypothetical protein GMRT_15188 [Giardia muris]|uniref:EGF-like domain-containing protein n=1 Tax=Giardia muris TaxID=5742 RepID=A0A4Z1SQJ1_GIAMU|nr:hypothetical protein GMRT_15188 [Giardia muris]|eukprot:TNJ28124.1 hypothetical protein GMRT_15188 [Giardia muris]